MKLIILCLVLLLIVACGIDNTMYNAKKYFREAQARPLTATGRPSSQAVTDYTKTIQKCGYILTERPRSKQADDALYLMARALYYKGNSSFQAKEQFENLIRIYPDSPSIPESYIYLAKVNRDINRNKDAEKVLEEFIRNPRFKDHHARALLILADFEIKDKDFYRAQYWLEKILSDYSHTKEHNEAFFLFGKNYYEQKDYESSLREFEKLSNLRRISKEL
ncbi:MAG: tetratricopeptide repeat protein, partial [Candidatus Cloacimonetes bacterium]|nr:tetratricopeptide repeat protein [Candidatus Cloacimonadota bacterium]